MLWSVGAKVRSHVLNQTLLRVRPLAAPGMSTLSILIEVCETLLI